MRERSSDSLLTCTGIFLAGFLIGGAAVALFTPASGRQMRKRLAAGANDTAKAAKKHASRAFDTIGDAASDFLDKAQDTAASAMESARSKFS